MTSLATVSQTYKLNGRTEFFFPFPVRYESHITLSIDGGANLSTGDYSVTGAGPAATGVTITYPNAPADGSLLTASRVNPVERQSEFTSDTEITAAKLNAEFDNIYQLLEGLV